MEAEPPHDAKRAKLAARRDLTALALPLATDDDVAAVLRKTRLQGAHDKNTQTWARWHSWLKNVEKLPGGVDQWNTLQYEDREMASFCPPRPCASTRGPPNLSLTLAASPPTAFRLPANTCCRWPWWAAR